MSGQFGAEKHPGGRVNEALEAGPARRAIPDTGTEAVAMGHLRAFVTVLVVLHHALLAYIPFAPPATGAFAAEPRLWRAFPIVDDRRWGPFGLVTGFNDIFFMSLMFL